MTAIWTQHYAVGTVADGEQVQLGIKAALSLLEIQVVVIVILSVILYSHRKRIRTLEGKESTSSKRK